MQRRLSEPSLSLRPKLSLAIACAPMINLPRQCGKGTFEDYKPNQHSYQKVTYLYDDNRDHRSACRGLKAAYMQHRNPNVMRIYDR